MDFSEDDKMKIWIFYSFKFCNMNIYSYLCYVKEGVVIAATMRISQTGGL